MECLDEQTVVAFVNGELTGDGARRCRAPPAGVQRLHDAGRARRAGAGAQDTVAGPHRRARTDDAAGDPRPDHDPPGPRRAAPQRGDPARSRLRGRPLPPAAPGRPRRHGRGLRGPRSRARPKGRDQDPARRHLRGRRRVRPPPARGAVGRQALASERGHGLRRRHGGRTAVPGDGADRRRDAGVVAGRQAAFARATSSACSRWPAAGWRRRIAPRSSTATSSRRT